MSSPLLRKVYMVHVHSLGKNPLACMVKSFGPCPDTCLVKVGSNSLGPQHNSVFRAKPCTAARMKRPSNHPGWRLALICPRCALESAGHQPRITQSGSLQLPLARCPRDAGQSVRRDSRDQCNAAVTSWDTGPAEVESQRRRLRSQVARNRHSDTPSTKALITTRTKFFN